MIYTMEAASGKKFIGRKNASGSIQKAITKRETCTPEKNRSFGVLIYVRTPPGGI